MVGKFNLDGTKLASKMFSFFIQQFICNEKRGLWTMRNGCVVNFLLPIILKQPLHFHGKLSREIKSQNLHTVSCVWVYKDLVKEESVTFGSQPRWAVYNCLASYAVLSCESPVQHWWAPSIPQENIFLQQSISHVVKAAEKKAIFHVIGEKKKRGFASWQTEVGSIYWAASTEGRALLPLLQFSFAIKEGGRGVQRGVYLQHKTHSRNVLTVQKYLYSQPGRLSFLPTWPREQSW